MTTTFTSGRRTQPTDVATSLLMPTSCGVIEGPLANVSLPGGTLEKRSVRVGRLTLVDAAPLHIAVDKGYFAAEGLTVTLTTGACGLDNTDKLVAGELDFGVTSYPNGLIPQAKDGAEPRVVTDVVQTTPDDVSAVAATTPASSRARRATALALQPIPSNQPASCP